MSIPEWFHIVRKRKVVYHAIMRRLHVANILWVLAICMVPPSAAPAQVGDVTAVHDPSIIQAGNTFYIFSTGRGIFVRTSTDLFNWKRAGRIFDNAPYWTRTFNANGNSFWAPDISFINGEYRLYYAVSSFGKTFSAIGLAVNKTLDRTSSDYQWIDRGVVIQTPAGNDWNAIDPCAFEDTDSNAWLALGSCWKGLKLVPLNRQTGLLLDAKKLPLAISANPPTNILEEAYIRHHDDFYYLWESVDHCCRGSNSDYRILVGRSKTVQGPYLDFDGKPMLEGGGTLVLASYDSVRGPGSCAVIQTSGKDFLIHHEYDATNNGTPTLQIRQLFYAADGWPMVGEPIVRPPAEKSPTTKTIVGEWDLRFDFAKPRKISLREDGSASPDFSSWEIKGDTLRLQKTKEKSAVDIDCTIADDGSFFIGRNSQGQQITATRPKEPRTK